MDLVFLIALLITSVIAVAYIVERGLALRWDKIIPPPVERAVENYDSGGDILKLQGICRHYPSPFSRLLLYGAEHLDWTKNENVDLLETRARHEVAKLERGLIVLEIIVGIAPLLGLVGTIYGLILLFGAVEQATAAESGRFAQGISLALRATLMGLCIAIPTLVAWSYYSKKVENLAVEMATLCDEFLRKHYRSVEPLAQRSAEASPQRRAAPRPSPATITPLPPSPETASDQAGAGEDATLAEKLSAAARAARSVRKTS